MSCHFFPLINSFYLNLQEKNHNPLLPQHISSHKCLVVIAFFIFNGHIYNGIQQYTESKAMHDLKLNKLYLKYLLLLVHIIFHSFSSCFRLKSLSHVFLRALFMSSTALGARKLHGLGLEDP